MTAGHLKSALAQLGWTPNRAAWELGVASGKRVSEWLRGTRPVPPYVAAAVRTHLALQECRATTRHGPIGAGPITTTTEGEV